MAVESRFMTTVGYTLAFASLCSLAATPTMQALADEGSSAPASSTSYSTSQSNASVASEKSETVNVGTYADGSVKDIEVSTTLKVNGNQDVADRSLLDNLKPDDEDVWFSNEGELVWHSPAGEDIVYTGTTQSSLPIDLKITYRYNGSYITPSELPGKSGHVVIRYDYVNNSTVMVDGVQVHTPFMAITGMLLDTDVFSNVQITNGKLIEDGDRLIAVGYAMPGLSSSLDMGEDVDIPEYFEVEADVVDFELKSTLTMVSPDMLEGFDTSDFNTGEYSDASSGLATAMSELTKGSAELADGIKQLADGAKELSDGAAQLDTSFAVATNEVPTLTNGVAQLHAGSTQLAGGLATFKQSLVSLKGSLYGMQGGASQLADGLSGEGMDGLITVLEYAQQELNGDNQAIAYVQQAALTVSEDIQAARAALDGIDTKDMTQEQLNALESAKSELAEAAASAQGLTAAQSLSTTATTAASGALKEASAQFSGASEAARSLADGLQKVVDGFGTDNQVESIIGAANSLKAGADQLDNGLATLEEKSGELATGMSQLASGVSQISQGASQLSEATSAAAEGSDAMTEGLQEFNDQGISKITDAIDNKLVKLGNRFTAITDAGAMYKNFAGITDGTDGSVKFVFETDAIEAE